MPSRDSLSVRMPPLTPSYVFFTSSSAFSALSRLSALSALSSFGTATGVCGASPVGGIPAKYTVSRCRGGADDLALLLLGLLALGVEGAPAFCATDLGPLGAGVCGAFEEGRGAGPAAWTRALCSLVAFPFAAAAAAAAAAVTLVMIDVLASAVQRSCQQMRQALEEKAADEAEQESPTKRVPARQLPLTAEAEPAAAQSIRGVSPYGLVSASMPG